MDPDTVRVLKLLDDVTQNLKTEGPVTLDEAYLRMIARVEAKPQNQDGADKSGIWECLENSRLHFARARLKK
ncbi:MAG: hypothetical protein ACYTGW_22965 [Planctomycetota bacterium]|jgi:hypothetical protein